MIKVHSGLTRKYLPTFNLHTDIPELRAIIQKTPTATLFINHVTCNHKGLNWKIFRFQLTPDNYKSFIYAFALTAKESDPCYSAIWQFESNARRLEKAINRNNIKLSKCENDLIQICKSYSRWYYARAIREEKMTVCMKTLRQQYLG